MGCIVGNTTWRVNSKAVIVITMATHYEDRLISAIIDTFKEHRKKQDISLNKLAQLSGVTRPTISFIESRRFRSPALPTCIKIARGLGMDFSDVVRQAEKRIK